MANLFLRVRLTKKRTVCFAIPSVEKATMESDQSAGKTAHQTLEMTEPTAQNRLRMGVGQGLCTSATTAKSGAPSGIQSVATTTTTSPVVSAHPTAPQA